MNKALIPALLLTLGTAMAGQPVITCTAPAPQPKRECPLTMELAAVYAFANNDILSHGSGAEKAIDIYGGDLTVVKKMDENSSVNLRFGYGFGDEVNRYYGTKYEIDVHNFYLMPGYRYTHALDEETSLYFGVNLGVANLSLKGHERGEWGSRSDHDSAYGLAYSAEVGLRYRICEDCEVFAAYEFCGSTASPDLSTRGYNQSANKQSYNAVRAGMNFRF